MNEEERRIHKERRKKQKRRRKERKREEARQANIADRRKRIEKKVALIAKEQSTCVKKTGRRRRRRGRTEKGTLSKFEFTKGNQSLASNCRGKTFRIRYLRFLLLRVLQRTGVVVKQLNVKKHSGETQEDAETRVRNELIYEARIINKLGDHPGLPLLFGVCSKRAPFRLAMQFHGLQDRSSAFTISSALTKMAISAVTVWLDVIRRVAEALLHVHNTRFIHNHIKGNNIVLDNRDGIKYNPF